MLDDQRLQRCSLDEFLTSADPSQPAGLAARVRSALNARLDSEASCKRMVQKLSRCGIATEADIQILASGIVERATARGANIALYAEVCIGLRGWCVEKSIGENPHKQFKSLLVTACQSCFESHLSSADPAGSLTEAKRRTAMLGSMRLLGCLIARGEVGARVLIAVAEELLAQRAFPLALESLVAFLAVAGGSLDRSGWNHYEALERIFREVQHLASDTGPEAPKPQTRRALAGLLDLRRGGWRDEDVKRILSRE